jgi:hypothetical protein
MDNHTTKPKEMPALLTELWKLLQGARAVFGQERVFRRGVAAVFGELFTLGRHTVTQVLRTLGETEGDWSAWYRLYSHNRFDEAEAGGLVLKETLRHVPAGEPYIVTLDGVRIPRTGKHVSGSSWWPAQNTAPFRRGLERAQRFEEVAWLSPMEDSYSRAVPLRWLPAVTAKALKSTAEPCKEWEAGIAALTWVRGELDAQGRDEQWILGVADGNYDVQGIWQALPGRTALIARCAKNRALYALPEPQSDTKRGHPKYYGERLPAPREWLHEREGWGIFEPKVRGRKRCLKYRVVGPVLVEGAPKQPLFLLVVKGKSYAVGKRRKRRRYRKPSYYLVSAVQRDGEWVLPRPAETLLIWAWQRWECEVGHREMKSALGVGDKQCWSQRAALTSVQWGVWVYALCVLAAYRCWGIIGGPRRSGRWYPRACRWSYTAMWQAFRADLWDYGEFRPLYARTLDKWLKKEVWRTSLWNAVGGAAQI